MTANCSFGARAFFLRAKSHYRVMVGLINSTRHRNGVNTRDAGSRNKCPLTAEDKNQGREGFLRCSFWNFSDHQPLSQGHFSVVLLFHLTWFLSLWSQKTDALSFIMQLQCRWYCIKDTIKNRDTFSALY